MIIKQNGSNLLCTIFKDIHSISTGDDHVKSVIGELEEEYKHLKEPGSLCSF